MLNFGQIAEGIFNNIFNLEEDLYKKRITICRSCKLFKIDNTFGEICNKDLYLNPETNQTSNVDKAGYVHGCGCILGNKCRVEEAKCPVGK